MISYEDITNKNTGLVSPSVADFLFGSTERQRRRHLQNSALLAKTAYDVCVLYCALVQAYAIGRVNCKKDQSANQPITVYDLNLPERAKDSLRKCWSEESAYDLAIGETVFSFLKEWHGVPDVLGPDALHAINVVQDAYKHFSSNARVVCALSEQEFCHLLHELPLIKNTEFDFERLEISIQSSYGLIQSKFTPFISFWDEELLHTVDKRTDECFIFTSIDKGDKNNELYFNTIEFKGGYSTSRTKQFAREISSNEYLRYICEVMNIQTEWYPEDDTLCCDLLFLKRLTDTTKSVLSNFWEIDPNDSTRSITPMLKALYRGTALETIDIPNGIKLDTLQTFLYEIFIKYGVYKSINNLFLDVADMEYSKTLFNLYMTYFVSDKIITQDCCDEYKSECKSKIEQHMFKLRNIISQNHNRFHARTREIKAEWRAYYVLKAAGINKDNLFADQEDIKSLDDYFDMIRNPASTLQNDLTEVLTLLIEMYGSILKLNSTFNEQLFQQEVWRIRTSIEGLTISELFDEFIDIVDKSIGNKNIENYLGRGKICTLHELNEHKIRILDAFKKDLTEKATPKCSEKFVFISYSHDDNRDDKIVSSLVKKWQNIGYRIVWDEDALRAGDHWRDRIMEAINACVGVFFFASRNSAISEAVAFEIEHAKKRAKELYPDNIQQQQRFIVPINLEEENVDVYLKEITHTIGTPPHAHELAKSISGGTFISYKNENKLEEELLIRLGTDDDNSPEIKRDRAYTTLESAIAKFYSFLKYRQGSESVSRVSELFETLPANKNCIFPMVVSIRETKIKRDNITLAGYEMITGKGRNATSQSSYILSSRKINADEYYCIPHYRNASADDYSWMVEPFLVSHYVFTEKPSEDENHE